MSQHSAIRIVFFGTPEFAIPSLRALAQDERFSIIAVVTRPDEPAGRGLASAPPVLKREAERLGLPVYQPESLSDKTTFDHLHAFNADMFVVVAYGRILPSPILSLPSRGVINVHPSLLPLYRGPSPIQTAILNGDAASGVSVILLEQGSVDAGPILAQSQCAVPSHATYASFSEDLSRTAAGLLPDTIAGYVSGAITPQPQRHEDATITKFITRTDGELDAHAPARNLERRVRAFAPWPGTYTTFRGKRLKVLAAQVADESFSDPPGTIVLVNKKPALVCSAGALLLDVVQLEGKSPITGEAFVLGYLKS